MLHSELVKGMFLTLTISVCKSQKYPSCYHWVDAQRLLSSLSFCVCSFLLPAGIIPDNLSRRCVSTDVTKYLAEVKGGAAIGSVIFFSIELMHSLKHEVNDSIHTVLHGDNVIIVEDEKKITQLPYFSKRRGHGIMFVPCESARLWFATDSGLFFVLLGETWRLRWKL